MVDIPPPVGLGRDTPKRARARRRLAEVLWDGHGRRRLPREADLRKALAACDRRDVFWVCEMSSAGPVYFLPTREWLTALGRFVDDLGVRRVLEVAAGDGTLSRWLRARRPRLEIHATDRGTWARPGARMSEKEQRRYAGVAVPGLNLGADVRRLDAVQAVRRYRPELTIVAWAPPGPLLQRLILSPTAFVLDIGALGDVTGGGASTWRFAHQPLGGPLLRRALCRLDARPAHRRHSRITLYYGKSSPLYSQAR